jgi:hypothetical protein
MAVQGALFFFCNSIWQKVADTGESQSQEPFSAGEYWGGLWFRLGEAVIFTLVFLLFMLARPVPSVNTTYSLPVIALLIGMFLKAGEALIYGIAQRLFDGFSAFIQSQSESDATVLFEYQVSQAVPESFLAQLKAAGAQAVNADAAGHRLNVLVKGSKLSASEISKLAQAEGIVANLLNTIR